MAPWWRTPLARRAARLMLAATAACGSPGARPATAPPRPTAAIVDEPGTVIAPTPQRPGDAARGWAVLTASNYVGCGVPRGLFDRVAGATPAWMHLPGRTGAGADLPYPLNAVTGPGGRPLVTPNCLACHAAFLRGQLVIGLGDARANFTGAASGLGLGLAGLLITDPDDRAAWDKLVGRFAQIAPAVRTTTVGANPADHIAAALFAHRDARTLAWSDEPRMAMPAAPIPIDVPAWWLLKKKAAMFHTGAGRGDQARIMMTASVLCVDDVPTARAIDAGFPDVRAYLTSLTPPRYPAPIDPALAARGATVFTQRCQRCHGSYGPAGRYRTRIVSVSEVGTDPAATERVGQFAAPFVAWFNTSFYGEVAQLVPGDGYVAPPLDGVWATAPYFHNGSVPTLAAVLAPALRAPRFTIERDQDDYDLDLVGWRSAPVAADDPRVASPWVWDTARPGHGNQGHAFAATLPAAARRALLEYLKTL
ncbi:MAG: hypothetical protein R3B06_30475 [Kofleriaceae bacterium]